MEHQDTMHSFRPPPFELSLELNRRYRNTAESNDISESPHIDVGQQESKSATQSELALIHDGLDCDMDDVEAEHRRVLQTDFRNNANFEEFRMPPFTSIPTLPTTVNEDKSCGTILSMKSAAMTADSSLMRNDQAGSTSFDGSDGASSSIHPRGRNHHRRRNCALGSNQFDAILDEVFFK